MAARAAEAIVAGHVCLDLIPQFPTGSSTDLEPGSLTRVGPAIRATGGPVSNVGRALHRLGVVPALMGKVGDDLFGDELLRLLEADDPTLAAGMSRTPGEDTSHTVVISPPAADRFFLHCPGANDRFGEEDVDLDRAPAARLLHFGYPPVMRRIYADGGAGMRRILDAARGRGVMTSLDMCAIDPDAEAGRVDWPAFLERVLPAVDLFVPSLDELRVMLEGHGPGADRAGELEAPRRLAARCLEAGAGAVAIKLGSRGLYLRTGSGARGAEAAGLDRRAWAGRELYHPCFTATVASTTGSGDCTIAGLLAGALWGFSPEEAVRAATATGACGVEAADAYSGVRPWAEIARRLAAGWPPREPGIAPPAGWQTAELPWRGPADEPA